MSEEERSSAARFLARQDIAVYPGEGREGVGEDPRVGECIRAVEDARAGVCAGAIEEAGAGECAGDVEDIGDEEGAGAGEIPGTVKGSCSGGKRNLGREDRRGEDDLDEIVVSKTSSTIYDKAIIS